MSEQQNELLAAMNALLAKASAAPTAPAAGWAQPQPTAAVQGVGIPVKVPTPIGEVRVYLWLDGAVAANPQAMQTAIQSLVQACLPVEAWQPRDSGWGGNAGWGGNNNRWRR